MQLFVARKKKKKVIYLSDNNNNYTISKQIVAQSCHQAVVNMLTKLHRTNYTEIFGDKLLISWPDSGNSLLILMIS